ncbi:FRIGIDA-like protein 4a [Aristolochia californica]|uniref:FRIGIDA-like protein 4a n=1 Tax=Aristolochia californica TaxID=171875 RepID=UPI0035D964AB
MGSAAVGVDPVQASFEDMERQTALMNSCTLLWKELSDHFSSLEQNLLQKSETLKRKLASLDQDTKESLEVLRQRETSIDGHVDFAIARVEERKEAALVAMKKSEDEGSADAVVKLRAFCTRMDSEGFWRFVTGKKKELDLIRSQIPDALGDCVDPATFVLQAISEVFPVDKRVEKGDRGNDFGWACVLVLEALVPVLADPALGESRLLVTSKIKEQAREVVAVWKTNLVERGGLENVKALDGHIFLQHVVTFGIVEKDDAEMYRKMVVASAWRKQMPKLAISLGLKDKMADIIEELIGKGQQVDAVHFTYEAGLVDKFPPVPLLKAFLKDSKKVATSILEDRNNTGRAVHLAGRKEQSAIRAVIKCIEEYKLENEFSPEGLRKRLEQLEKVKTEKKKPAVTPANKRTRVSSGGPMPPAKAGRLNNAYVSSFPTAGPTYVLSPSSHTQYPPEVSPYSYDRPAGPYGSRSPPSMRDAYAYPPDVSPAVRSYPAAPVGYPAYGGYGNGMAPAYQQAYYR